jgi:hypothetical protein
MEARLEARKEQTAADRFSARLCPHFSVCIASCTLQRHLRALQRSATRDNIHRVCSKVGRHVQPRACIWERAANGLFVPSSTCHFGDPYLHTARGTTPK